MLSNHIRRRNVLLDIRSKQDIIYEERIQWNPRMPYALQLTQALRQAGWKVKIHDFERLETPHATIYRKKRKWRLSLRDGAFLDRGTTGARLTKP